jgi:hypothetical protein
MRCCHVDYLSAEMLFLEIPLVLGNDNTGILMAGTTKCTVLRYLPGGMVNYLKKGDSNACRSR